MNRQTRILCIQNVHLLCTKPLLRHNPHYWHVSEEAAVINYQEFISYQDLQWLLSSLRQEQRLGTRHLKKKVIKSLGARVSCRDFAGILSHRLIAHLLRYYHEAPV